MRYTRRMSEAERESRDMVPYTCPDVDAAFADFKKGDLDISDVEKICEKARCDLRAALVEAIHEKNEAVGNLANAEHEINDLQRENESLKDELKSIEASV